MQFFRFLAFSNVYVSLGAAALTLYVMAWQSSNTNWTIIGFVFFATLFAYNIQRKLGKSNHSINFSEQDTWTSKHNGLIHFIIIFSFLGCSYFFLQLPYHSSWLIVLLAVLSLLYVLEIKSFPSLRMLPFFKVFVVGFVWAGVVVLIPISINIENNSLFTWPIQLMTISVALFIFGESLPFDIRDLRLDKASSLQTFPIKFGVSKTKFFSALSICISFFFHAVLFFTEKLPFTFFLSFSLAAAISIFLIKQVNEQKQHLYYSLVLESILLLPFTFLFIFQTMQTWITT